MLASVTTMPRLELVFQCDIAPCSRRWLANCDVKPSHFFADLIERSFHDKAIITKTLDDKVVKLTRGTTDLDWYVVGFPCTPFSDKGKRGGWQDPPALNVILSWS